MSIAQFTWQSSNREVNAVGGCVVISCMILAVLLLFDVWKLKRSEEVKLLWTLVLCLIPILGLILYIVVGRRGSDPGSRDPMP